MNTYVVTLQNVRGEVLIKADGFYVEGKGDLVLFIDVPVTEPVPIDKDEVVAPFVTYTHEPVLSYATGIWRSVMKQGSEVEYRYPTAQGRATRENPERRQEA